MEVKPASRQAVHRLSPRSTEANEIGAIATKIGGPEGRQRREHTDTPPGDNTRATALEDIRNRSLPGRTAGIKLSSRGTWCSSACALNSHESKTRWYTDSKEHTYSVFRPETGTLGVLVRVAPPASRSSLEESQLFFVVPDQKRVALNLEILEILSRTSSLLIHLNKGRVIEDIVRQT